MKNIISDKLLRKLNVSTAIGLVVLMTGVTTTSIFASAISNVTQTITAGTLSVDIVDAGLASVGSPSVAMSSKTFSFTCQNAGNSSTGIFGTTSQQIYVKNPDAADGGWGVTLAATDGPTAKWIGAAAEYDFNDPTGSGCTDGADAGDTLGGQLTVDTSTVSNPGEGADDLTKGTCLSCTGTGVSPGTGGAFSQGSVDSVTLITGAVGSADIGDWTVRNYTLKQTIPAETPAASDYDINMTMTII